MIKMLGIEYFARLNLNENEIYACLDHSKEHLGREVEYSPCVYQFQISRKMFLC